LKAELRKRKVKVSGKKARLVERLIILDSVGRRTVEPGIKAIGPGHMAIDGCG